MYINTHTPMGIPQMLNRDYLQVVKLWMLCLFFIENTLSNFSVMSWYYWCIRKKPKLKYEAQCYKFILTVLI